MPELTGSVGYDGNKKGNNKVHDVCLVQAMLRAVKSPKKKAYVTFGYDGSLGKDKGTHKAIAKFQDDYDTAGDSSKDKPGLITKDGPTFKKLVALLPAEMKNLRTIENVKLVYLEGKANAAKSAEATVTGNAKFVAVFRNPLAKLIRDMYKKYGIVLSVVPKSGSFRTFDDQSQLYSRGRDTAGNVVTGAGPGESNHNYGNGADLGMDGFTWITKSGTAKKDAAWLNHLSKSAFSPAASTLWKLRNKLTRLHPSAKKGDLIHLQSFSDAKVSMRRSLLHLLNKVGNMDWEISGSEYRSNYGLGDTVFNIGKGTSNAQAIWKQKCDVSGTNLATALNQAKARRDKAGGKLPAKQEQIYADLMAEFTTPPKAALKSSDIKKAQYNKMRKWLKKDFELAEKNYASWQPVDASGKLLSAAKTPGTPKK